MYSRDEVINAEAAVPELEALLRRAMVPHNQYPWAGSTTRLATSHEIGDDDFVVLFYPRDDEVADFIQRVRAGGGAGLPHRAPSLPPVVHPSRITHLWRSGRSSPSCRAWSRLRA